MTTTRSEPAHGEPSSAKNQNIIPPPPESEAITAVDLVKVFNSNGIVHRALNGISFSVSRGHKMAVLGRNGAGKSTLIRLISGLEKPTSGHIERNIRMSWPIALSGGLDGSMTGYDAVRFISTLYNRPLDQTLDFVQDFAELGRHLYLEIRHYSDGMRARLAFGLSLSVDFDCFLIDEVILVGDPRFQKKCQYQLFDRRKDRAMIVAIHDVGFVKAHCDSVLVLKNGRGRVFEDLDLAGRIYMTL